MLHVTVSGVSGVLLPVLVSVVSFTRVCVRVGALTAFVSGLVH